MPGLEEFPVNPGSCERKECERKENLRKANFSFLSSFQPGLIKIVLNLVEFGLKYHLITISKTNHYSLLQTGFSMIKMSSTRDHKRAC